MIGNRFVPLQGVRALYPFRRVIAVWTAGTAILLTTTAQAVPVNFAIQSSQSSITINIKNANLFGLPLTTGEQSSGSSTSKYTGTLATDIIGKAISFPGGTKADASVYKLLGLFDFPLEPGVGGVTGSATADYGLKATLQVDPQQPNGIPLPPLDLSFLGLGTLNLGSFKAVEVKTALRDVLLDVTTPGYITRQGTVGNTTFDSSLLDLSLTGNADVKLAAVLHQDNLLAYGVNLLALQGLASLVNGALPDPIMSVTGNLLALDISIGIGTRLPLNGIPIPNDDASLGKLTTIAGNSYRLTVPVNFDAVPELTALGSASVLLGSLLNVNLKVTGQLVGTTAAANLLNIPEPASIVTFGIGLLALAGIGWRRKWRRAGR